MKLVRLYASAALFLLLTAGRVAVPSFSSELNTALNQMIKSEEKQTEELMKLGDKLSEDKNQPKAEKNKVPEVEETPAIESPPAAEPTPNPKVEAFLEAQSEFSDYEKPENVSYDAPRLDFEYAAPVDGVNSSGFGYRLHPIYDEVRYHYGTDFAACVGTEIKAFADGVVKTAELSESYGNYIIVEHADGCSSLYAHCSELLVSPGQEVKKGEVIALVGETGLATGPHLHFELKQNDMYLNPEFYL